MGEGKKTQSYQQHFLRLDYPGGLNRSLLYHFGEGVFSQIED